MLNEVRDKYHMMALKCGIFKKKKKESYIIDNRFIVARGGKEGKWVKGLKDRKKKINQ